MRKTLFIAALVSAAAFGTAQAQDFTATAGSAYGRNSTEALSLLVQPQSYQAAVPQQTSHLTHVRVRR